MKKLFVFVALAASLYAQKSRPQRVVTFTAGGTADAITGTPSPALAAYSDLSTTPLTQVCFTVGTANTGAVTLNLNGLGTKDLRKGSAGSLTDLAANDLSAGQYVCAVYLSSPDDFILIASPPGTSGGGGGSMMIDGSCTANLQTGSTNYCGAGGFTTSSASSAVMRIPVTGNFKDLWVHSRGYFPAAATCTIHTGTLQASANGVTATFTGSSTALTVTIPANSTYGKTEHTGTNVAVTAGDSFVLACTSASNGAGVNWGVTLE